MPLIAQNHFEFILGLGSLILAFIIFLINLFPIPLALVTGIAMFLSVGFTLLFGFDAVTLFLSLGQSEFTHPFGPLALLTIFTCFAAFNIMSETGVDVKFLKRFMIIVTIALAIFGGLMHKSFLILWILGIVIGILILSKSFRREVMIKTKYVILFIVAAIAGFLGLEGLSRLTHMDIFSPLLRITRIEGNSGNSLGMVIDNFQFIGHKKGSCYWGDACLGFADGYISLPMSLLLTFGVPFPMFFGLLVSKKDVIDYMLPGIFGFGFDWGILGLLVVLGICALTIFVGFSVLKFYRTNREKGNKGFLAREALLVGSLTAFIAQGLVGLFIMCRSINGTALLTFIFLSAMVLAHAVILKRSGIADLGVRVFGGGN